MEQMLRAAFPEFRLEVFSVDDLVKRRRDWFLPNLWYTAREFPGSLFRGKAALRNRYFRTTYLFRRIKEAMGDLIDPRRHVFSFQTQSMYDTSVPGVPHFLHTDHTHLSNLASPYFDRSKLRSKTWIRLEQTIYENASLVFTRSSDVTNDLIRHYRMPQDKIACVHFGTNVRLAEDFALANDGYANKRILFIGRDWERKGGPELLQAFGEVLKVHPTAELVIVGAKPDVTAPNCIILGDQSIEQLSRLYAEASVFCVPSRLEPFGVVFLEAMMHRLPVVSTRIAAIPDMVRERINGCLVEPGDTQTLARVLTELLTDPALCRRYGEAGHAHVTENYTWEKVGGRVRAGILPFLAPRPETRVRKI